MIAVPLPFVVALVLGIYALRLGTRWRFDRRVRRPVIFALACAILLVAVGLRWQFDIAFFRFLLPVLASVLPVISWICFASFDPPLLTWRRVVTHGFFTALILLCSLTWDYWHPPIDFLLCAQFAVYGLLLLRRAGAGDRFYGDINIGEIGSARRIVAAAGGVLILSALVDAGIALDFAWQNGLHVREIVAGGNAAMLAFCVFLIVRLGRHVAPAPAYGEPVEAEQETPSRSQHSVTPGTSVNLENAASDRDIAAAIDQLMQTRKLYRDPALTLDRLSRRAIIPARDISLAINRFYGRNISCIINEYRIAEATQLLADTDKTVTDIQFDCGFQTKSNFNREFRRVTGMSPRDYRNRNANQPGTFMTPFNAVPETQESVG